MNVLAIDIGGSGSRIVDAAGRRADGPPPELTAAGYEHAAVVRVLGSSFRHAGSADVVALSAAGLVSRGDNRDLLRTVTHLWNPRIIVLASDAVAAVVGAWGLDGGAIVAAGTGVVGLGTDLRGSWHRSDGWGHLLGDEGGAAWIGRGGLVAALRARDGRRGGSGTLLDAATELFGPVEDLPAGLRDAASPSAELARFAPEVTRAASAGDPAATAIVDDAANHLADTGLSVLSDGVPLRLALSGGLSTESSIASAFVTRVRSRRDDVEVVATPSSPLDGALTLAQAAATGTAPPPHAPYLTFHTSNHQGES